MAPKIQSFSLLLLLLIFSACSNSKSNQQTNYSIDKVEVNDSMLNDLNKEVLTLLKNKEFQKFAEYIHPEKGIRFSPYDYIDTLQHIKLSGKDFLNSIDNPGLILNFGNYEGSGEPIQLSMKDYLKKFGYSDDYISSGKVSINHTQTDGNKIRNFDMIYPENDYVENLIPGKNPKNEGMDWSSLTLVFEEFDFKLYLVGLVHDQWTI